MGFRWGRFRDGRHGNGPGARRRGGASRRARRTMELGLEGLEARVVLSLSTWSGAGAATSVNWSNAGNWDTLPTAGSDLSFPVGVVGAGLSNTNDLTAGTAFGSLAVANNGYTIAGNALGLTGGIDASLGSGSSSLGVAVDLGTTDGPIAVDNLPATLVMNGVVSGSNGLTKQGQGTLDLMEANTYTGTTAVAQGRLNVDGSTPGAVTLAAGGTLGGTGSVGSIASTGGSVSPGDTTTGVLTDTGDLTLDAASTFSIAVNGATAGTDYSQLAAGGAIDLAGAALELSVGSGFTPTAGQTFTILSNTGSGPISGTFAGLAEGASVSAGGQTFTISYQGGADHHSVVLTAVATNTATWSGGDAATSNNWSDTGNWDGGIVPANGYDVVFPANLTGPQLTSNNDISGLALNSITIAGAGYTITGDAVGLSGGVEASQTSGGTSLGLPLNFTSAANTSVLVDSASATLVLGGALSGVGLSKQGSGVLELSGISGSLGAVIGGGTLQVDQGAAIGSVSANTGTTLMGSGTVAALNAVGAVTVQPSGATAATTGTLTSTGAAVFSSGTQLAINLNGPDAGASYGQLQIGGTLNLASAALNLTLGSGFVPTAGEQFTIVNNAGAGAISGTFAGLAEGSVVTASGQSFAITYKGGADEKSVVLTALTATTTTISPVTTSPVFGQSVALQATVAPSAGSGVATGTVDFKAGATDLGTAPLDASGVARLDTTKLPTGSNQVTAVYSGDSSFATSTSVPVTVPVAKAKTTAVLTSNVNPSAVGQPVTLRATIAADSPGAGVPTGTVTFQSGTTNLGTANVASGVATFITTSLPPGASTITAVYSGDTNFNSSTSNALAQRVAAGATSLALSASNTNPFGREAVTLTATVNVLSGSGIPTGTVNFYGPGGAFLGGAALANGQAEISTATLPIGQNAIAAVYSGDANFTGSTAPPITVLVGSQTERLVNQIYLITMGGPAGVGGNSWIALLNAGYSTQHISTKILNSHQGRSQAVEGAYMQLLGRRATRRELKATLARGTERSTTFYAQIFGSKEYYLKRGKGTVDGFLNALALDWFGAPFPAAQQARLARKIAHGASRRSVALGVLNSPPGVHAEVNSIFQNVLKRPATRSDQAQFAPLVQHDNIVGLYSILFASREFKELV